MNVMDSNYILRFNNPRRYPLLHRANSNECDWNFEPIQGLNEYFTCWKGLSGNMLPQEKEKLMVVPNKQSLFNQMMTAYVKGTATVLKRQHRKSFTRVKTSTKTVLASVRQHTMKVKCHRWILREETPHAYISSISNKIQTQQCMEIYQWAGWQ